MPKYRGIQKKGKRWYWYIDYNCKRSWSKGFLTAQEAKKDRAITYNKIVNGTFIEKNKITLKDFIIQYAEEHGPNLSKNTLTMIEAASRLYITPELGHIKLQNIKVIDVQRLQNKLLEKKNPHYVHSIMCNLRTVLNKAIEWSVITSNPALKVPLPRYEKIEYQILTPEQLLHLLDVVPVKDQAIIGLAGLAGFRLGEVFGMKWKDIDFKNKKIYPERQFNKREIKILKTKASRAPIPLHSQLTLILKEWKLKSRSLTWLFPSKNDKPMNPEGYERRQYKKLLISNGLPVIRFHDLRHNAQFRIMPSTFDQIK